MSGRPRSLSSGCAAAVLILATATSVDAGQDPPSVQTLCILDFQRLGDDSRADWLEQGLADLMISTMSSFSPYLVIERRHLREILREHGLAAERAGRYRHGGPRGRDWPRRSFSCREASRARAIN